MTDRLRNLRERRTVPSIIDIGLEAGKLPPQAPDIEQAVLGQLMLERKTVAQVADMLLPETFYVDTHRRLYEAIQALYGRDDPVDILTVTEECRKRGELDIVGGPFYISQLTNKVNSTANIQYHVMILVQKHMLREAIRISSETMRDAYDETADCFEVLDKIEQGMATCHHYLSHREVENALAAAHDVVEGPKPEFIPFNTPGLERLMCQKGLMHIVGARTGMGKSIESTIEAWGWTHLGRVALFSTEMTRRQIISRILSNESGIPYTRIMAKDLTEHEAAIVAAIHTRDDIVRRLKNLLIDDTTGLTPQQLRAKIDRMLADGPLVAVVIDHLHDMQSGIPRIDQDPSGRPRTAYCATQVNNICRKTNLPFLVMAQLNRASEGRKDKRPIIADLFWSSDIEQKAALIILLYRAGYYTDDPPYEDELELIVAKYRDGAVGTRYARIIPALNRVFSASSVLPTLVTEPPRDHTEPVKEQEEPF